MNTAAEDMATVLLSGQTKWVSGTNLFLAQDQDTPNSAIVLLDQQGLSPDRYATPSHPRTEKPGFQVLVRDMAYRSGYSIARYVVDRMALVSNRDMAQGAGEAAMRYGTITQEGDILPLGKDDRGRYTFSMNFVAVRESTV